MNKLHLEAAKISEVRNMKFFSTLTGKTKYNEYERILSVKMEKHETRTDHNEIGKQEYT